MRKRIAVVLLLLAFVSLQGFAALAETRTVELEGTGISFQVDSAYDVVTEANKQDYPREIPPGIYPAAHAGAVRH